MRKLFLSVMILLSSSVMCMQLNDNTARNNSTRIDQNFLKQEGISIKDLVSSVLANEKLYEDCTDEERYSIAIQVEIDLWNESKFDEVEYYRIKNDLISSDTVNKKLKEYLEEPSIISFAQKWQQGFKKRGCFMYKERYAYEVQSLQFFPLQLVELPTNITKLCICNQQFTVIPGALGQLTQLTYLDLSRNRLNNLPELIACLTQLQSLNISYNDFDHIPKPICELINLEVLDVNYNRLTYIPDDICRLTKLRVLCASCNQIAEVPKSIECLTQLEQLFLCANNLTDMPNFIASVAQLQSINISYNEFKEIPESIYRLRELQVLDANNNEITHISWCIGKLTKLLNLNLSHNQLQDLPYEITNLCNLARINIFANHFTERRNIVEHLIKNLPKIRCYRTEMVELTEVDIFPLGNLHLPDYHRQRGFHDS